MWQSKPRLSSKGIWMWIALLAVVLVVSACGKSGNNVVASYPDGTITQGELNRFLGTMKFFYPQYEQFENDPEYGKYMLDQLIAYKILYSRADQQSIREVTPRVQEEMNQITQIFEQMERGALDKQLKQLNIDRNDLRSYIERTLVVMVDLQNKVTDDDLRAEYDQLLKEDSNIFAVATVSHILVGVNDATGQPLRTREEALTRAREVQTKLQQGGDFAALAKEFSDDGGSKENGGTYADAAVSMWVEEFKQAALTLPLNVVSEPVETIHGYHLMKVASRSQLTFDDVKNDLKLGLVESRLQNFVENELPGLVTSPPA